MEDNQTLLLTMSNDLKHISEQVDSLDKTVDGINGKIDAMRDEQSRRDTRIALLEERVAGLLKIVWAIGSVVGLAIVGALLRLVIIQ